MTDPRFIQTNLDPAYQHVLKRLATDDPFFARYCLKIVDKGGKLVPLVFNKAQTYIHERIEQQKRETGMVRAVIVKGRQQGCTTYIQARFFRRTNFFPNLAAFVLAHQDASTKKIFAMTQKFRQNLPPDLQFPLVKDTERGMTYENGSGYDVGTAGSAQVGRGTTVHLFHGSEVGFYENADQLSTGLLQAVADVPGTEMIFESTANGPGNFFYNLVQQAKGGKNSFILIFVPWYWQDEYKSYPGLLETELDEEEKKYWEAHRDDPISPLTLEHLAWRRKKIADFGGEEQKWKFVQEYPFTVEEAFVKAEGRFFDLGAIYACKARKTETNTRAALIIGVDQGRTGDETSISRRQGNRIFPIEVIPGDDGDQRDMRLAGHLANIIDREHPDMVFIDVTNEHGTMDRLHELGYKKVVRGIHFGEQALDPTRHRNKRTEMHVNFRDWTKNADSVIPDDQKLISEIGAVPKEKESSNNVQYLVSKDDIKSDLGWSPNRLDAVILTFAYPVKKKNPDVEAERAKRQAERQNGSGGFAHPRYNSRLQSLRR